MHIETAYARRGDISIAFQAVGDGPLDVILGCGLVSHMDLLWGEPRATDFLRGLAGMGRLLLFDKPGTGLSDPVVGVPTVEQRAEDFLAVLDAATSRRAVVVGFSEAVTPALMLAATHPDRVEALVCLSGAARVAPGPGYTRELEARLDGEVLPDSDRAAEHWGDGKFMMALSPFVRRSPLYRRLAPSIERAGASPGMARAALLGLRSYDVTNILGSVRTPTIVVHRTDEWVPVGCGRYVAENVPGAQLAELSGDEHMVYFAPDDVLDVIGTFVGGGRPSHGHADRRLLTVLYTDIVDSTATAAKLGDMSWRSMLAQHDTIVADEIERHEGRLIKKLGDGALATFDRPTLAIRCALAIRAHVADIGITIRAGIHAGECQVAEDDITGIAVHIGARIVARCEGGEVLVSSTVRDLVSGSGVEFADRGTHELKGVAGLVSLFAIVDDRTTEQQPADQASAADAALTPASSKSMRLIDRAIVGLANHAPMLTRAGLRLTHPRSRGEPPGHRSDR